MPPRRPGRTGRCLRPAAFERIGSTAIESEAARYTADRLVCADARLLIEAVDAIEGAMQGGAR